MMHKNQMVAMMRFDRLRRSAIRRSTAIYAPHKPVESMPLKIHHLFNSTWCMSSSDRLKKQCNLIVFQGDGNIPTTTIGSARYETCSQFYAAYPNYVCTNSDYKQTCCKTCEQSRSPCRFVLPFPSVIYLFKRVCLISSLVN